MTDRKNDYILALALCAALAVYPLMRGGWDLWSQLALQLTLLSCAGAWVLSNIARGRLPLPPQASLLPACVLLLGFVSLQASPARSLARPEYQWWAAAVSLAFLAPFTQLRWRDNAVTALLSVGVATVPLAFYQRFLLDAPGAQEATGPFFNANMYAGYLLLLLPLALAGRKWVSAGFLLCGLVLAGSRGAWLVLALTAGLWGVCGTRRKLVWGLLLGLCALAGILAFWHWGGVAPHERLAWWCSALQMIAESPLLGFGPGTFEYVFPAFHEQASGGLSSIYAHNWPLQFAAEYGLPCALVWLFWAVSRLRRLEAGYRWAVIAVFLHSLGDFTLNGPALFFIFCWLLSCADSEGAYAALPGDKPVIAGATALAVAAFIQLAFIIPRPWLAQRGLIAARNAYHSEYPAHGLSGMQRLLIAYPDDSNAALLLASAMADSAYSSGDRALLAQSAVAYERAVRLNPFRPATYTEMAALCQALGRPQDAELVLRRKAERFR